MTYAEIVKNLSAIKRGMPQEEVFYLLGDPETKESDSWQYNFKKLEGFPDPSKQGQIYYGATIIFEGEKVREVNINWTDIE